MPPARPEFCYYEALNVEKTASQQAIIASYRNLARIHHPDKNPNDGEATARFQRIQAAHETLSDPTARSSYDRLMGTLRQPFSTSAASRSGPQGSAREDWYYDSEEDDSDDDWYDSATFKAFNAGTFSFEEQPIPNSARTEEAAQAEMQLRYLIALLAHLDAQDAHERRRDPGSRISPEQQRLRDEQRRNTQLRKDAAEKAMRDREAAWKAEEEQRRAEFAQREEIARQEQEKIFEELNITIKEHKQQICLHKVHWVKAKQKKARKCQACRQKRGSIMFICPHCELRTCQYCFTKFKVSNGQYSK